MLLCATKVRAATFRRIDRYCDRDDAGPFGAPSRRQRRGPREQRAWPSPNQSRFSGTSPIVAVPMNLERFRRYTRWHAAANARRYRAPADPWRLVSAADVDALYESIATDGYRANAAAAVDTADTDAVDTEQFGAGHEPADDDNPFETAYANELEPLVVVASDGEVVWTELPSLRHRGRPRARRDPRAGALPARGVAVRPRRRRPRRYRRRLAPRRRRRHAPGPRRRPRTFPAAVSRQNVSALTD